MTTEHSQRSTSRIVIVIAFFITLITYATFSLNPTSELWGLGPWRHLSSQLIWGIVSLTTVVGMLLSIGRLPQVLQKIFDLLSAAGTKVGMVIIASTMTIVFYVFRVKTHFLGDGYTLLSNLASQNPLVKPRSVGESLIHIWVKNAIGDLSEDPALYSYQFVSILCGILFVLLTFLGAQRLFQDKESRALFTLGVCTGGYSLLYFGYVENYSVLSLMTLAFCLHGVLTIRGLLPKWSLTIVFVITAFTHILGVVLFPGLLFVLIRRTRLSRKWKRTSLSFKVISTILTLIVVSAAFIWKTETDLFFRLAFLSLSTTEFTVDGYTLFSKHHILDFISLILLLCPWVFIAGAAAISKFIRSGTGGSGISSELILLLVLCIPILGLSFAIDPKLGMSRDWDLFAFSGIPLSVLFYLLVLTHSDTLSQSRVRLAALSILISLYSLSGNVAAQNDPSVSVLRFEEVLESNVGRSRSAYEIFKEYYLSIGDSASVDELSLLRRERYPEIEMALASVKLLKQGNLDSAMTLNYQALRMAPAFHVAYTNIGLGWKMRRQRDSAIYYLQIADGLNPYSPIIEAALRDLGR